MPMVSSIGSLENVRYRNVSRLAPTNTIASHECRWRTDALPGSISWTWASIVRVSRSPSAPT
jgi:hypothetical protein